MVQLRLLLAAILLLSACTTSGQETPSSADPSASGSSVLAAQGQWLYVITADAASVRQEGSRWNLQMTGVNDLVTAFTDRPARQVRTLALKQLADSWPQTVGATPPNAAITPDRVSQDRSADGPIVVELGPPEVTGDSVQFPITPLPGGDQELLKAIGRPAGPARAQDFGATALFIDDLPMPPTSIALSAQQGFDHQKDPQASFGYVTSLTVGTTQLTPDLTVTDGNLDRSNVVGVLTGVAVSTAAGTPLEFQAQISAENQRVVSLLAHEPLSNTEVTVSLVTYSYDPGAGTYYRSLYSPTALRGQVATTKPGGPKVLQVSGEPSGEVTSPVNFAMTLGMVPNGPQTLMVADSASGATPRQWG